MRKGHKVYAEGQLRPREFEGNDGQKRTSLEIRFARVVSLERRDPGEGGYSGSFNEQGGGTQGDAPVARPRGAESAPQAQTAESIDVDDIPF
jgi:single-stranded DNA-binding protein